MKSIAIDDVLSYAASPIIWTTQCTVDYKVKLSREQIIKVLKSTIDKSSASYIPNEYYRTQVKDILGKGLKEGEIKGLSDAELQIIENAVAALVPQAEWRIDVGGSPAISAIAAYFYNTKRANSQDVFFVGNVVGTVSDFLRDSALYRPLFKHAISHAKASTHKPRTLSLEDDEGRLKVMIPYSSGRKLSELNMKRFIGQVINASGDCDMVTVGLGGLNKGQPKEYLELVSQLKDLLKESATLYVGTNSFVNYTPGEILGYCDVMRRAEVVSFNDEELRQVFSKLGGKLSTEVKTRRSKKQKDKTLIELLLEVDDLIERNQHESNKGQIKICHAPSGVIACIPDSLAEYKPALQQALESCVDATSYRYLTGIYPFYSQVEDYRAKSPKRQEAAFKKDFGPIPPEIICAAAPSVTKAQAMGNTTGLGAVFDGIFSIYVSALFDYIRRKQDEPPSLSGKGIV